MFCILVFFVLFVVDGLLVLLLMLLKYCEIKEINKNSYWDEDIGCVKIYNMDCLLILYLIRLVF